MKKVLLIFRLIFARSYVVATKFEEGFTLKMHSRMSQWDKENVVAQLRDEVEAEEHVEQARVLLTLPK